MEKDFQNITESMNQSNGGIKKLKEETKKMKEIFVDKSLK